MKLPGFFLGGMAVVGIGWAWMPVLHAQAPAPDTFPGVRKALTPEQYAAAGLGKLSPEEQARLDEALKGYFTGATEKVAQQAASQAVDKAVKEKRVETPTLIESNITGTFTGWNNRTVFVLDNGQRWKPIDNNTRASFPPIEHPQVYIVRDAFGYKMGVLGGTTIRVRRVGDS